MAAAPHQGGLQGLGAQGPVRAALYNTGVFPNTPEEFQIKKEIGRQNPHRRKQKPGKHPTNVPPPSPIFRSATEH